MEGISYPTIRNIINTNNTEEIQEKNEERCEIVEKTLSEIFDYENFTEESVLELIYNLKRIGKICNRDLGGFIEDIEVICDQYFKHTNEPIKLFDFLMDISREMSFITESFDIEKLLELIGSFIDQHIFLEQLREEYNSVIEFKEAKKQEREQEREKYEARFDKLIKIANDFKELNQNLSNTVIRAVNIITNQKTYYKKRLGKPKTVNINSNKIKDIIIENQVLKQLFMEFKLQYPKEVKDFVIKIKNEQ